MAGEIHDVQMPDGTIVRGVPVGTTKAQLLAKLGHPASPVANDFRSMVDSIPLVGHLLSSQIPVSPAAVLQRQPTPASPSSGDAGDLFAHDFTMGADVPVAGAANAMMHPTQPVAAFQQGVANRRAQISSARAAHPVAGPIAEAAGAITSAPGNMVTRGFQAAKAAPGIIGRLAAKAPAIIPSTLDAMGYGGAVGASEGQNPLTSAALAGAGNVGGSLAMKGASRILSPILSRPTADLAAHGIQLTPYQDAVRTLNNVGTRMTPGQISGGGTRTVEDALATVPVVGSMQKAGQRRALESFNLGAINNAIAPVGQLPKGVRVGRDAIGTAQKIVGDAYDKALTSMSAPLDEVFHSTLSDTVSNAAQNLTPDQFTTFQGELRKHVTPFVGPDISGQDLQGLKRGLDARIAKFGQSSSPADEHIADALSNVRDAFMSTAQRYNPDLFQQYQAADQAYRNMAPINIAAANSKTEGVITPLQYSGAVARRGYGTTTNNLAAGTANGQDIANAASMVLPAKLPSSGTAERAGILALLGGSGAAAHFAGPAAIPAAALSIPYIPALDRAYQAARLAPRGPVLDAIARGLQLAAPAGGMALAPLAVQQGQ